MSREISASPFDVVVLGGSYAGLSATLQLARARRRVLVVDAGAPRNRRAVASHGFLGQDGRPPATIAADGRAQVLAYPTVTWTTGSAIHAAGEPDDFRIHLGDDSHVRARRLVLAMGVTDHLPAIPGLDERWGRSVFHCPYCHGYELHEGRIGVLAVGPPSLHHAMLLPDWGTVTLFTNGVLALDADQRAALVRRGVSVEETRVARIEATADVVLADGRVVALDGLFTASRTTPAGTLADDLGCALDAGPLGTFIRTDMVKATTVPGVFACGDAARAAGSVALAVGDGAMAGMAAHQSLVFAGA